MERTTIWLERCKAEMARLNSLEDIEGILTEDITSDDRILADMMIRNGNSVDYTV